MKPLVPMTQFFYERGLLPDMLLRWGMRQLLRQKIKDEDKDGLEFRQARLMRFIHQMYAAPIALHTQDANEQHYEMPTEFFQLCLGKNLKYSSAYYHTGRETLNEAEDRMLALTCERADLADGQTILELGCGWGSLSLWMASHYPRARITAVSNSCTQKEFIDTMAKQRNLKNLTVITCDMNTFTSVERFDRVVSVEMFEHMRNWGALLEKVAGWLKPEGKLFIHIFTHREHAYLYDHADEADFIAKYFFTGGMMPSDNLLLYFQDHLRIQDHWIVPGTHYGRTANHWLENMDKNQERIMPMMRAVYGQDQALQWYHRWRLFYMACAELWHYNQGKEWIVSHYRFVKKI